ncbi:MAG: response regulator [Planctomycetota bacterium]
MDTPTDEPSGTPDAGETPRPDPYEEQAPLPEERGRLFDEATREADRYKWIESEKAGHDLGENALRDWHKNYWRSWCRERWIEHLHGDRFWVELDQNDYGLLRRQFSDNLEVAEKVIDRIKEGGENLDIIQWAAEQDMDLDTVLNVLKTLDINARRIAPPVEFTEDEPTPAIEEETTVRTRRALVVDDDEDTRMLLSEILTDEGLEVSTVGSGEDAIAEVERRRFHCFLIDIMLPGKHGAEVAWYLRRHCITAPVIAISAVLDCWNEDDLYDCGFTGIMSKPFDVNALRDLAHDVLNDDS